MKLIVVTGSAGFIGTNLVKKLLERGDAVLALDNFYSSENWKAELFKENENYEFIKHNIVDPLFDVVESSKLFKKFGKIEEIYNLACPASPPRYIELSLETIDTNTIGTKNILDLAKKYKSKVLHTSTSEVYGDPEVHPQPEEYRGNVNTVGPRSCYDEGKRISETICYEYKRLFDLDIKLVRIFNTYGPYMDPNDGRVITNFILQALKGEDLTVYEEGQQTRSFQYIDDLVSGFLKFMETSKELFGPINLGNPGEFTIKQLAELIIDKTNSKSKIKYIQMDKDNPYKSSNDPQRRKPDISTAKDKLKWEPAVKLEDGLDKTIDYYKNLLNQILQS